MKSGGTFLLLTTLWSTHHLGHAFAPVARSGPMPLAAKTTSTFPQFATGTILMNNKGILGDSIDDSDDTMMIVSEKSTRSKQPTPVLVEASQKLTAGQNWTKQANVWVAALFMAATLSMGSLPSEAAMTGGRIGGSYRTPSVRMASPSRSSFSSRGYGAVSPSPFGRGFGSGFASGYGSGVLAAPRPFFSPFYNPFFSPGYYGGPGVITYSRGPGLFPLLLLGGFAWAIANSVTSTVADFMDETSTGPSIFSNSGQSSTLGSGTSVVQLSVAMEVSNRDDPNSILSVLNRLAQAARTDSRVGIQNLTSQVALELLRRKSSIVSASSSSKHFGDRTQAFRKFSQMSVKERAKFERETVSNYGGVDYSASGFGSSARTGSKATMAVVTLLLNIDGDSTGKGVAKINSINSVEEALRTIAADSKVDDCLQSAEILWTPEDRTETLSLRDVVADYPELRSV